MVGSGSVSLDPRTNRQIFLNWLRTGQWRDDSDDVGFERKFNPYHDPRNGRFTFAPGGPRSLSRVIISDRVRHATRGISRRERELRVGSHTSDTPTVQDAVFRPGQTTLPQVQLLAGGRSSSRNRAGGGRLHDPLTLAHISPQFRNSPAGKIVELVDSLLGLSGMAGQMTMQVNLDYSKALIADIKKLDPLYPIDVFPSSLNGQFNHINNLRFSRASILFHKTGELQPLQVEIIRFMQRSASEAYERGLADVRSGKLKIVVSEAVTLGNYIDREVRSELRDRLDWSGIDWSGKGPVRVNKNEYNTSSDEKSFRRPDVRVGDLALDTTLTRKNFGDRQITGFFGADFRPSNVAIIRPIQLGENSSYILTRPGEKK